MKKHQRCKTAFAAASLFLVSSGCDSDVRTVPSRGGPLLLHPDSPISTLGATPFSLNDPNGLGAYIPEAWTAAGWGDLDDAEGDEIRFSIFRLKRPTMAFVRLRSGASGVEVASAIDRTLLSAKD